MKNRANEINDMFRIHYKFLARELGEVIADAQVTMKADPVEYTEHGCDEPSIDIRLCVDCDADGPSWIFRVGLADFDQRHSEFCAASSIGLETKTLELLEELISQVMDQAYEAA